MGEKDSADELLDNVILKGQQKFMEAIKETYPLAVLSSLCIAISAFTQINYPQALVYAITGASLFLVAFASSLVFKMYQKFMPLAFFSISSTALAILMLFLVIMEFGSRFQSITRIPLLLIGMLGLASFSSKLYSIGRKMMNIRNVQSYGKITMSSGIITIVVGPVLLSIGLISNSDSILGTILAIMFIAVLITGFVSSVVGSREVRKQRLTENSHN